MVGLNKIFLDNEEVGVKTYTYHWRTIGGAALMEESWPGVREMVAYVYNNVL